jgi:hypothetical protein
MASAWSTRFPTRCDAESGPHRFVGPIFSEMSRYKMGVNLLAYLPFRINRCVSMCGDGGHTVRRTFCGHHLLYLIHGACSLPVTLLLVPTEAWGLFGGGTGVVFAGETLRCSSFLS